jgi:hypothetical protein
MKLTGIDQALKDGCRLHAFRSGGGLRVVRLEKDGKLKGYGEHPQVEDALSHTNEDFLAGGRPYDQVYGVSKPHYLTGSSHATSDLDHWLMQGHTFDAWQNGAGVVFQLKGLARVETPKEIIDRVLETGRAETWTHRDYTYRIFKSHLPNGDPCTLSQVVKSPKGKKNNSDCWMYYITKTGHGADFTEAMHNALKAKERETDDERYRIMSPVEVASAGINLRMPFFMFKLYSKNTGARDRKPSPVLPV